ncbi:MAG TPA: sugar transferase [Cyclobacteriaceae bacterium]|nr:sugar transferase [Cyclobacteriaceae bacterium]
MFYRQFIKAPLDIFVAVVVLVLISPLLLIITIVLLVANNGNPFFTQPRIGYRERIFHVIKFRTMNNVRGPDGQLLSDADRLTAVGKFVRKTSLDELPQLLNIAFGQMSFVGPRPLLLEYLPLYSDEQRLRHRVMPGVSGWAQVNGRNSISWKDKFAYDVWYVNHQSFWLDLRIIFITIVKVLKAEGISGEGVATVEKFNGIN